MALTSRPTQSVENSARAHSIADPTLTRKGMLTHPGSLATGSAAILFALYVFNVGGMGTWTNALFSDVTRTTQAQNAAVVHFTFTAVPYIAAALLFLLLFCVFRWTAGALSRARVRARLSGRHACDPQEFSQLASEHFISSKVANATYQSIAPFYHGKVRCKFEDDLRQDLGLTDSLVEGLILRILHLSDRRSNRKLDIARVHTLLDLMRLVEEATPLFLTETGVHRARGQKAPPRLPLSPAVGETRMLLPLHKRVQEAEKAQAQPPAVPAADAKATQLPPAVYNPRQNAEVLQPLHKRL